MLASGSSSKRVIEEYMEATGCTADKIYVVSLFAGSYEPFTLLEEMGVKV